MKAVKDERITVTAGTFQDTSIEDGWADAVVIAQVRCYIAESATSVKMMVEQAFHWCIDYEGALREFARILKPGGVVSFIWNNEDTYVESNSDASNS